MGLDVRASFPITKTVFESPVTGAQIPLVYMDHAASTHPPIPVIEAHEEFLRHTYANVHRGAHHLSLVSTEKFEDCRWKIRAFTGARKEDEVVFTHNTTSALNLAAHLMGNVPGKTLVTQLEHHSNDLPHRARGPVVRVHATSDGRLDVSEYKRALTEHKVKLVAVTAASNVTGIMPPLAEVIDLAHKVGARVLVDGAQALAHLPLQLAKWGSSGGPDMFAAPGHKAYAPFGAAFLLARKELVEQAEPFYPGGGTVRLVTERDVLWSHGYEKQEGGTPNVSGVVALGAAIDFLRAAGMQHVRAHEVALARAMFEGLAEIPGVHVFGAEVPVEERVGVASFHVDGVPHGLVSTVLDHEFGVATRNGCFCAHPYLTMLLGIGDDAAALHERIRGGESTNSATFPGATRASIGIYNNAEEVERLLHGMRVVAARKWAGKYLHDGEGWRLDAPNAPRPIPPEI
ncbi:MAG TPA: aminotransferase class V-fold PLP-dependent enzyme [Candidatus Thermoplasmatota archaeon]|jgi:selenocysteine lyase/cysteine desulfurase|nr:aminotransferase class V-fold PLP-dependent enzyme [Candidatus Thermoplasmatota archaeon]